MKVIRTKPTSKIMIKAISEIGILSGVGIILGVIAHFAIGPVLKGIFLEGWVPNTSFVISFYLTLRFGGVWGGFSSILIKTLTYMFANSSIVLATSPWAFLLDYCGEGVGFMVAGMMLWTLNGSKKRFWITLIIPFIIGLISTFLSGEIFYGEFAPSKWGKFAVILYSGAYNGLYMISGIIITLLVWLPFLKKHSDMFRNLIGWKIERKDNGQVIQPIFEN